MQVQCSWLTSFSLQTNLSKWIKLFRSSIQQSYNEFGRTFITSTGGEKTSNRSIKGTELDDLWTMFAVPLIYRGDGRVLCQYWASLGHNICIDRDLQLKILLERSLFKENSWNKCFVDQKCYICVELNLVWYLEISNSSAYFAKINMRNLSLQSLT